MKWKKKTCSPAGCVFSYHIGIWNTALLNSETSIRGFQGFQ